MAINDFKFLLSPPPVFGYEEVQRIQDVLLRQINPPLEHTLIPPSKELPLPPVNSRDKWAKEMLMMRLDTILRQRWMRDGDFVTCHHMQDSGMVVTFYCFGADTGVVEDEQELFPSDALISQLRLLRR